MDGQFKGTYYPLATMTEEEQNNLIGEPKRKTNVSPRVSLCLTVSRCLGACSTGKMDRRAETTSCGVAIRNIFVFLLASRQLSVRRVRPSDRWFVTRFYF